LSTILKALKRIDQTAPPPEDLQSWPVEIDTKKAVRKRVHRIWFYRKAYLALILTVIAIAAGGLIYSQKHRLAAKFFPQKASETDPIYQAKIDPAAPAARDAAPEKTPPQKDLAVRPGTASELRPTDKAMPPRGLPRFPASPNVQKNPIFTASDKSRTPAPDMSVTSKSSRPPTAASRKSVQKDTATLAAAAEGKPSSRAVSAARAYRRLDESKLKLQAIAWSNNATQRIAVINGRIVREGESIEGFVVNQIRQEDVVVNDGSMSWQLEFGLRQ
jgi:hypothetical protein